MIIPIKQAREILRIDGNDNDDIIIPLLKVIPEYLDTTTGYRAHKGIFSPLAVTTASFLLQLWYNPDGTDTERLQRTINNLLTALSCTVQRN